MATKTFKIGLSNADKAAMAQDVYERVINMSFDEYDSSETYNEGDFVVYEDPADTFKLYKCTADNVTGAWDSSKWELATFQTLVDDVEGAVATVNNKANVDGNYPTMTVGLANNLDTKVVQNDVDAYNFRTSGGSLEIGDTCKVKKIVGGSLGFNQLAKALSASNWTAVSSVCSYADGVVSFNANQQYGSVQQNQTLSLVTGHKYLLKSKFKLPSAGYKIRLAVGDASVWYSEGLILNPSSINDTDWHEVSMIGTYTRVGTGYQKVIIIDMEESDWNTVELTDIQAIDLTAMFGATIADYIYSLEQAEAGSGVAWFRRYFNKPYYAYTAVGAFQNVKTRGKKIVKFNQWDEVTELGAYDVTTGEKSSDNSKIRSKNKNKVLPNTTYRATTLDKTGDAAYLNVLFYDANENFIEKISVANSTFTTPENAQFLTFYCNSAYGTTYNHDICINFHYDGERDGEYEPFESETYANDDIELIGIPKIDAQGNLYYEGNVYNADGTVNKKFAIVDLSTLEWSYSSYDSSYRVALSSIGAISYSRNVIASKYDLVDGSQTVIGGFYLGGSNLNVFANEGDTPTGYLVYELATPTEDSATPFQETQQVDNWGTEQWLAPTSDTRPCEVPVGHDTDYLLDLKSKLEIMPDSPSADGDYVVHTESGVNTYISLGSWLSSNGYVKLTDITGYDDTKTQTLKNVEGVLTWVDDE